MKLVRWGALVALAVVATGCAPRAVVLPQGLAQGLRGQAPSAIPAARSAKPGVAPKQQAQPPRLLAEKVAVHAHGAHEAHVEGEAGALVGAQGVWVSVGQHLEPSKGYEAKASADGGFELALHAHPGDALTVWAFRDEGERRLYGEPLALRVPAGEATPR